MDLMLTGKRQCVLTIENDPCVLDRPACWYVNLTENAK